MTLGIHVGQRIRQARERAQISQVELARRIGISANALCSIEAGEADPRASRIVAIAQELGVSTDALLLGTPPPPAKRPRRRTAAIG
jgi:transcriptional regulator with XRE-family HTH domain